MILFSLFYMIRQLIHLALLPCPVFGDYVFVIAENRFSGHHFSFVPFINSFVCNVSRFGINGLFVYRSETRCVHLNFPLEA